MTFHPLRPERGAPLREDGPRLFVRPREGYLVRDPTTGQPLRPEGQEIRRHRIYYERRIATGDCERITPPPKKGE
jgi:hypothetical protein